MHKSRSCVQEDRFRRGRSIIHFGGIGELVRQRRDLGRSFAWFGADTWRAAQSISVHLALDEGERGDEEFITDVVANMQDPITPVLRGARAD